MYLCCVETLSSFQSHLDFLKKFKVASTMSSAKFHQKSIGENLPFL